MPNLHSWPSASLALCFVVAALVVWWSGVRLAFFAKGISEKFGHPAFVGILLLGGIASLPEGATTVSAALLGNPKLAINTLLGGIAVTLVIIAIADAWIGWEPLSTDVSHSVILLHAVLVILLLVVAAIGIVVGDVPLFGTGVGVGTSLLFGLYLLFVLIARRYDKSDPWVPKKPSPAASWSDDRTSDDAAQTDGRHLAIGCAMMALVTVSAGFVLASSGDALAEATGLGDSFVGLVLGGISTSLPELSTTLAAVRLRQYEMAFADAFGTNLFSVMLLFFADLAHRGEPLLRQGGRFSLCAILLGIGLTAIYLGGLIERRNRAVMRMGVDSILVILVYVAGLIVLFHLR